MFESRSEKIKLKKNYSKKNNLLLKSKRIKNNRCKGKINNNKIFNFLIVILIIYVLYKIISAIIFKKSIKKEALNINNSNFSLNLSRNELYDILGNENDVELFLKNKTLYYYKKRKYYLKKSKREYNESHLITFQDKLNYLLIHESCEYKSLLVDKIRVREYSQKKLGKNICVPVLKIYNNTNEINLDELPEKFVLKCNHGSGMNILVKNKNNFNFKEAKISLNKWMKKNFAFKFGEMQYLFVERKIFLGPYLGDNLSEYKIYCFNGEPKYIVVSKPLKKHLHLYNYYNIDWTLTDIEPGVNGYIRDPSVIIEKPKHLNLMIEYAKILSNEFVFVRVDLYEINDIVYLSEMTFNPTANQMAFKNKEQSIYLGSLLDITKIKSYLFNN